jgi:hypothetical protein
MCSTPKKLWSIQLLQIKIKSRSSDSGARNKAFRFYFFSRELRAWEERKDPVRAGETTFFYLMVRNTIVYIRISTVLVWLVKNPKLCSLSPGEVPSWRGQFWIQPPPAFDHLSSCFFPPFIYYPVGFIGNGFWYIKKMVGWGGVGWRMLNFSCPSVLYWFD